MSQRKIGVILSYIALAINAIIGFVYVPLLLQLMGESEYGLYQLMGSLTAYLSIMDFGMSSTIIRYYSHYRSLEDEKSAENSLAISAIIYGFLTLLIIVVGIVLYFNLNSIFRNTLTFGELNSARKIFLVQLLNVAITIPSKIFDAVIISHERFIFLKGATILQTVLMPVAVILILMEYPYALSFVSIQAAFNIALIGIKVFYCFKKVRVRIKLYHFDRLLFKEMLGFSAFIFLNAVMDQLFWNTNKIILGVVASTVEVAIYGIAMTIFNAYMSVSTVITSVFLPRVTAITARENYQSELSELFIKIGRIQYILLSCILSGFILFGKQFIELWAGKDFQNVYFITLCLIVPFTIDLIQNIGITILQAENKMAFRSISFLLAALVNIVFSVFSARVKGGIGCAISTGLIFIVVSILLNIYYDKCIHLEITEFWKQIVRMTVPCVFSTLIGCAINKVTLGGGWLNLMIKIGIYCIVFLYIMWNFSFNSYEKNLVQSVFKRLIKR